MNESPEIVRKRKIERLRESILNSEQTKPSEVKVEFDGDVEIGETKEMRGLKVQQRILELRESILKSSPIAPLEKPVEASESPELQVPQEVIPTALDEEFRLPQQESGQTATKSFDREKEERGEVPHSTEFKDFSIPEARIFEPETEIEVQESVLEKELELSLRNEGRERFNKLLEARGAFELSKADFQKYFSSRNYEAGTTLVQGNTGDCYFVAALHAMSISPHFETMVRSSVKRFPDGTWHIKIPFLDENAKTITISQSELGWSFNKKFLQWTGKSLLPETRPTLHPLVGKEGLKTLEAAYIKHKFGSVDRLAAEGGWPSEVLDVFGSENFKAREIDSSYYDYVQEKWKYPGLASLKGVRAQILDHFLETFDPEIHMATVSTKHFEDGIVNSVRKMIVPFYRAKGTVKLFVPGHAYSISKVDAKNKTVTLANPWFTKIPIKLTFEQFKSTFSRVYEARLETDVLLKNLGRKMQAS